VSAHVAVLRGRTSDRSAAGAEGAQALGEALAARLGVAPALIGEPGAPRDAGWEEDLRDGCTIAMATLPARARRKPGTRVFVHLRLDVLDPDVLAFAFPAPNGLEPDALRAVLAELAGAAEPIGVEITSFVAPTDAAERERLIALIADVVAPLMP
jgi:hypothetical protein